VSDHAFGARNDATASEFLSQAGHYDRSMSGATFTNWSGLASCTPAQRLTPSTEDELIAVVADAARSNRRVKVVGAGHSFTPIAMTDGVLLSLDRLDRVIDADTTTGLVTVEAGIRLKHLNDELATRGLAMANLGDIVEQSVAGALSTGTHGTGIGLANLSSFVDGMRLVTASGEVLDIDRDTPGDLLAAARVSIGALGVISRVRLRCVPAFRLHAVEETMKLDAVLEDLDAVMTTTDHAEFYWMPGTRTAFVKRNSRTDEPLRPLSRVVKVRDKFLAENIGFGLVCRVGRHRPSAVPKLTKLISAAPSRLDYIDRSDKVFASTRLVRFAEMEYSIPYEHLRDGVNAVRAAAKAAPHPIMFPIEVRCSAADDALLSMGHGRRSGYIAIHQYAGMEFEPYFRSVEAALREMGGRPHWGKVHFRDASSLRAAYPRFDDFLAIRARVDPEGRFDNGYLARVLGSRQTIPA
jgi:L-gulono-1,4-lactone dehydrogenase